MKTHPIKNVTCLLIMHWLIIACRSEHHVTVYTNPMQKVAATNSCDTTPKPSTCPTVSQITIKPSSLSVNQNSSLEFAATATYSDGTTKVVTDSVKWSVTPTSIATQNATNPNKFSFTSTGDATVTASLEGVSVSASGAVKGPALLSLYIIPDDQLNYKGATRRFTAIGVYADGSTSDLTDSVTWSASNSQIATADAASKKGNVALIGSGSVAISASYDGISTQKSLSVSSATLLSIDLGPSTSTLAKDFGSQFSATGTYSDGVIIDLSNAVTWSTSNAAVADVSNAAGYEGWTTGKGSGTAVITGTVLGVSDSVTLTVSNLSLSSISLSPSSISLAQAYPYQLRATGTFSDTSTVDITDSISWTSGGTAVTVGNTAGSNGLILGSSAGSATITGQSAATSGTSTITSTSATLSSIAITPVSPSIKTDQTIALKATATYSGASTLDITKYATWSSSDNSVAVVGNKNFNRGIVSASINGTATISAKFNGTTGSSAITVSDSASVALSSIAVTPKNVTITNGSTQQFKATGHFTDGTSADLTATATWSSSTTSTATINASTGLLTSVANGLTTISATKSGLSDNANATVTTTADTTVPTAGSFSASTSVGAAGFTLNWSAATDNVTAGASLQYFVCSGANAAAIDTASECTTTGTQEMNWTANTLTLAITGKSPSTTYYYNVVVKDAAGNQSLYDGKTQTTSAGASSTTSTAGTAANDTGVGTKAWSNVANAQGSTDGSYSSVCTSSTGQTNYLWLNNFSGLSVPSGATINGIEVTIRAGHSGGNGISQDNTIKLVKAGSIVGSNNASASTRNTSGGINDLVYGSSSDLWGTTWSDTDFGSAFGIAISHDVNHVPPAANCTNVDSVSIKVYYTP
jgi:trimeric autotransporter adhesin